MTTQIYRDAWGIPHLRAGGADELARAQGRVTAHDRAWQLEAERHRAQGTSAAFLGISRLEPETPAREPVHEQHVDGFGTVRVLPLDRRPTPR